MAHDEYGKIRCLLEEYFDGNTTREQENILREFLSSGDVPQEFAYAKLMFSGMGELRGQVCPVDVETVREGTATKKARTRPALSKLYKTVSIAAAAAFCTLLGVKLIPQKPTVYCYLNGQPVTDIHVAERQAEMAGRLLEGTAKASAEGLSTMKQAAKPIERLGSAMQLLNAMSGYENED